MGEFPNRAGRKPRSPEEKEARFWSRVDDSAPSNALRPCWLWRGPVDEKGYGRHRLLGEQRAHRIAWRLTTGRSIPEGFEVMHSCDNPRCVRPAHLSIATHLENMQDSTRKGRRAYQKDVEAFAKACGRAKLTANDVREIRRKYPCSVRLPIRDELEMCRAYGVNRTTIQRIRSGQTWSWLEQEQSQSALSADTRPLQEA